MGCLCSLLKSLSSYSPSVVQSFNSMRSEKKHILKEEAKIKKNLEGDENVIEQSSGVQVEWKNHFRRREPQKNIIRSSSQITSSLSSPTREGGEEEKASENGEQSDETSKRGEYLSEPSTFFSSTRDKHSNSEGSSVTPSSFLDHDFPSRPTFVHRAPSLRHHSKNSSKSISSSVDCVSSNSLESSSNSNPISCHLSDPSLVQMPSNSTKLSMNQNKRVTFCEHNERIE